MDLDYFTNRLSQNRAVFESLLLDVPAEQAVWKPAPEKWSMLEVVNHLYDEEREDFRARLELTLKDPAQPWPAIDPQGWVMTRKYGERELRPSLDDFLSEREKSLAWLKGLTAPAWESRHEVSGSVRTAGDLLASWLAHDFLHIRQLTRLHWQYISVIAAPYETAYGGPWQET
ncbi:MAG: DinB family protein [Pyrinomonadaceae bacterium]